MLYCYRCSIAIRNVSISDNFGSLFTFSGNISFQEQVVIRYNKQQQKNNNGVLNYQCGGAVTLVQSNAMFSGDNRFEGNEAENGGAVYSSESILYIGDNFIVVGNRANSNSGGMHLYQSELICQMEGTCYINISSNSACRNG